MMGVSIFIEEKDETQVAVVIGLLSSEFSQREKSIRQRRSAIGGERCAVEIAQELVLTVDQPFQATSAMFAKAR